MKNFHETTFLSKLIEESHKSPIIVFKFSSECGSSERLYEEFEKNPPSYPVHIVTVQKQPGLSAKIEEMFDIQHESPQIIILHKGKVTYTAHHSSIQPKEFVFE